MKNSIKLRAKGDNLEPYLDLVQGLANEMQAAGVQLRINRSKSLEPISTLLVTIFGSVASHLIIKLIDTLLKKRKEEPENDVKITLVYNNITFNLPEEKEELLERLISEKGIIQLRSQPMENLTGLVANKMLVEKDFFHPQLNKDGKGIKHEYEEIVHCGEKLIIDHATGLTWQQSGSDEPMTFEEGEKYIHSLNEQGWAGHNDWCLPTLEEAMSLMEPIQSASIISPLFDQKQHSVWTADKEDPFSGDVFSRMGFPTTFAWIVDFSMVHCCVVDFSTPNYIRAVRRSGMMDELFNYIE